MKATVLGVLLGLSFIGMADAGYLAQSALSGTPLVCDITALDGCNAVAQSDYSRVFGVPLSVYGFIFYAIVFAFAGAMLLWPDRRLAAGIRIFAALGALASLYFIYLQAFYIQAFCVYCLLSAVVSFAIAAVAFYGYRLPLREGSAEPMVS